MKLFKKFLYSVLALAFVAVPLSAVQAVDTVETEATTTLEDYSDFDWDAYYDELYDTADSYSDDLSFTTDLSSEDVDEAALAALMGGTVVMVIVFVITGVIGLAGYIYMGITMMKVAKKLNHENPWFAWIPILNVVQVFQLGEQNPWLILLVLIPGLGALIVGVISIIALMKICEKRGYDKLLALLMLIPIGSYIVLGMLAWGKKEAKVATE